MSDHSRRPWFGPKRVGWGISPQTWQGWVLTAAFLAVAIAITLYFVP